MGKGSAGSGTQYTNQTSTTTIPPEVLAQYKYLTDQAKALYESKPDYQPWQGAYIAPVNNTMWQGLQQTANATNPLNNYYAPLANTYTQAGAAGAQKMFDASAGMYTAGLGAMQPYYNQASQYGQQGVGLATQGLGVAGDYVGQAAAAGRSALDAASPYFSAGASAFNQAVPAATPYLTAGANAFNTAVPAASPYLTQASAGYNNALNTGMAGLGAAGGYIPSGSAAVNPNELEIQRYESPYQRDVIDATMKVLQQQYGQQSAAQQSSQIMGGYYGGDRANTDAATLALQQGLSSGQTLSALNNQNYAQALGTAQQQQGLQYTADTGNRAAQQWAEQAQAALAQAGYGMGATSAAGQAGIGSTLGNLYLGQGQGLAGIGNTMGNLYLGTGQGLAGIGAAQGGLGMNYASLLNQGGLGLGSLYNQAGQTALGAGSLSAGMGTNLGNAYMTAGSGLGNLGQATSAAYNNAAAGSLNTGTAFANASLAGGAATMGAGQQIYGLDQKNLDAQIQNYYASLAYPFQTLGGFLAPIVEGVGSLYPTSTTSSGVSGGTTPQPFFSDERVKENIEKVGKLDDGTPVHKFNYKGQPGPQIGLLAQEVEKRHPEAVGSFGGIKTVDYDAATRSGKAGGGGLGMDQLLMALKAGGLDGGASPAGINISGGPYGTQVGPAASGRRPQASPFAPLPQRPQPTSTANQLTSAVGMGKGISDLYTGGKDVLVGSKTGNTGGLLGSGGSWDPSGGQISKAWDWLNGTGGGFGGIGGGTMGGFGLATGGRVGRASGGGLGEMPYAGYGYQFDQIDPNFDPGELRRRQQSVSGSAPAMPAPGAGGAGGSAGGGGGKALGSAAGAIAGSFLPIPGGSFLGGTLGGLLGGLFRKDGGRVGKEGGGGLGDIDPLAAAIDTPIETDIDPTTGKYRDILPGQSVRPVAASIVPPSGLNIPQNAPQPPPAGAPTGLAPPMPAPTAIKGDDYHAPDKVAARHWMQESGDRQFRPDGSVVTSSAGAVGRSQLHSAGPEAAKLVGEEWDPERAKKDEAYNRKLGDAWLGHLQSKYNDPYKATAAYNAGSDAVDKAIQKASERGGNYWDYLPGETQNHLYQVSGGQYGRHSGQGRPAEPTAVAAAAPSPTTAAPAPTIPGLGNLAALTGSPPPRDQATGSFLDRYERPIVSGLSFLGGMLSSPSRQLTGAIGSGLAAAAPVYAAQGNKNQEIGQRAQQLELSDRQQAITAYGILAQRAAGLTASGQPVPPEMQALLKALTAKLTGTGGAAPPGTPGPAAPGPIQLAGGPPPVTASGPQVAPSQPPAGAAPSPVTSPQSRGQPGLDETGLPIINVNDPATLSRLRDDNNHELIRQRAMETMQFNPELGKQLLAQSQQMAKDFMDKGAPGKNGEVVYPPGFQQRKDALARAEPNQKRTEEMAQASTSRAVPINNLAHIAKAMEVFQPGTLSEAKTHLQGITNAAGLGLPDTATMNAKEFQTFLKNAFSMITSQGAVGTDAQRDMIARSSPNVEYQPETNKRLVSQLLAQSERDNKLSADWNAAHNINAYLDYPTWYQQQWATKPENQLKAIEDRVYANMAVRGATPDSIGELKPNHMYIIEPRDAKKFRLPESVFAGGQPAKLRRVLQNGAWGWSTD